MCLNRLTSDRTFFFFFSLLPHTFCFVSSFAYLHHLLAHYDHTLTPISIISKAFKHLAPLSFWFFFLAPMAIFF
jgi:hypothetical protein